MKRLSLVSAVSAAALLAAGLSPAVAQPHPSQTEALVSAMDSPNRGAPYNAPSPQQGNGVPDDELTPDNPSGIPPGVTPLERDIWNSPNFYLDREYVTPVEYTAPDGTVHPAGSTVNLWHDPRYTHCSSNRQMTDIWTRDRVSGTTGEEMSANARWGECDLTASREDIISPYPFDTARDHYYALMAEAEARGGPTTPSYEWLLDVVSGAHTRANAGASDNWVGGRNIHVPEFLSLLTPEYQTYMMMHVYYEGVVNSAQWAASLGYPEGLQRWWRVGGDGNIRYVYATPHVVTWITGIADNLVKQVHIGRTFEEEDGPIPWLGSPTPHYYGRTIGFWDGDMLVTWTSSLQQWFGHTSFDYSYEMQVIEIFTSMYDDSGCHIGWESETVFYDPLALVEPVRAVITYPREEGCAGIATSLANAEPRSWDYLPGQWNVDGVVTPLPPGAVIEYLIPDMRNRPHVQNWIHYFEQDLDLPPGIPGRTDQGDLGDLF